MGENVKPTEVKRYWPDYNGDMQEGATGGYVDAEEYDDLATHFARVSAALASARAEVEALRERNKCLTGELSRSFMALPLIPSNTKAWDGSNLYPHVVAVADEFAIRTEQIAAHSREVERLRERERVLTEALTAFLEMYVRMVNSGDCGSWDPETEDEVIAARAALSQEPKP